VKAVTRSAAASGALTVERPSAVATLATRDASSGRREPRRKRPDRVL